MEARFNTEKDHFEIIDGGKFSKSLSISIAYFRWLKERRSPAPKKLD